MLTYVPFSLGMLYKLRYAAPDNVQPRKQSQTLAATSPVFARILAAEGNLNEGFPFFAAAVLAAVQAGVADPLVCRLGAFWLLVRLAYVGVYVVQNTVPLSAVRSLLYGSSIMVVSKLFYLAAAE
jgi:uncharacterized MAPEG superfamily protein